MAALNPEGGWAFLANPHTASRATLKALLDLPGSLEAGHHHCDLKFALGDRPEVDPDDIKIVFQTVRNPLDWLVSRYHCNGGLRGAWEPWLKRRPTRRLFNRFVGQVTASVHFEQLEAHISPLIGVDFAIDLDPEHITPGRPSDFMDYWTPELVQWARDRWPLDFQFGY